MNKWYPIETAPKDGLEILTCNTNQGSVKRLICWNRIHGYWQEKGQPILNLQDTHWTPLTDPQQEDVCKKG